MMKMVPDKFLNGRICSIMSKKDSYICVEYRYLIEMNSEKNMIQGCRGTFSEI